MYLEIPGQEEVVFIGYIESWLILRPTPEGGPGRNDEWKQLLNDDNDFSERTEETAIALQSLFNRDGTVQYSLKFKTLNEPRPDGTSIEADLVGPQATELVYINCLWIDSEVRSTLTTCSGSIITHVLLTYFLQSIVFWQWDRSSCLELVL